MSTGIVKVFTKNFGNNMILGCKLKPLLAFFNAERETFALKR